MGDWWDGSLYGWGSVRESKGLGIGKLVYRVLCNFRHKKFYI